VENVLPFVLRFVKEWRAGKTTIKEAMKRNNGKKTPPKTQQEIEDEFLKKIEFELDLPDYDLFSKLHS
jgi:anoctamin-10